MRTATLTWYTGNNYGSTMQAYALQTTLKKLGHTNDILAYSPKKLDAWKLKFQNHSVKATLSYKINEFYVKKFHKNSQMPDNMFLFDAFREQYMTFSKPYSSARDLEGALQEYDAFLCGSDQIWSPYYFDPVYFLNFVPDAKRKVPYAPSLGVSAVPEYAKKRFVNSVKAFEKISVREQQGADVIKDLTGLDATVVADPSLLLTAEEWADLAKPMPKVQEKPYILCYFLRNNDKYHQVVQTIAKKHGLEVRIIPMVKGDFDRPGVITEAVGPQEWISLIANANMVVTDSFHCTVFSILFEKDFATFRAFAADNKRSQNSRIEHLLHKTGLEDRIVGLDAEDLLPVSKEQYRKAKEALKPFVEASLEWLKEALTC